MSVYDILMLAIFVGSVLFGAWKGLAWQVASLAAVVVSYFVAMNFREPVAAYLQADPPWNKFGAMLILFLGTSFAIWMVFGRVRASIKKMHMGGFDRQAGALLGAVKGALLCMVATMFGVTLLGETTAQSICDSRSGGYITRGINHLTSVVPDEIHGVLEPYVAKYNEALNKEREGQSQSPFPNQPNFTQSPAGQPGQPIYGGQQQQNYAGQQQQQQNYGQFTPIQNPNANQNYQTYNGQWQQNPQSNNGYNQQQQQYSGQNQGNSNQGQYGGQAYQNPNQNQRAPQYGQGYGNSQQPNNGNAGYQQYGNNQQQQPQQPTASSGWPKIEIDSRDLLKAGTEALKESAQRFIENQNR